MLARDDLDTAFHAALPYNGRQVAHFFDQRSVLARAFGRTLGVRAKSGSGQRAGKAWDVYLVYRPGQRWSGADPPPPAFWMHQLESLSATVAPVLDAVVFRDHVLSSSTATAPR
jgi:hypothetical protein